MNDAGKMGIKIDIMQQDNPEFIAFLRGKVRDFNDGHSSYHAAARKGGAIQPISITLSNQDQKWVGGITAEVYWNWVEITWFWFDEKFRGKGLGSMLIEKTEQLARGLGAEKALVTTFEFQARSFYAKHGFKVVGVVEDYPPGSHYYTMVKRLEG